MPTYLSPGVYVEEVEAGARPIEGVGTAVAAFVGFAPQGPFNTPTLISYWGQYTQAFGEFSEGCYLAHAVYGYLLNGGGNCYVVRIGGQRGEGNGSSSAGKPQAVVGGYRLVARGALPAGKTPNITVEVASPAGENPPDDRFVVTVKEDGKTVETHNVT